MSETEKIFAETNRLSNSRLGVQNLVQIKISLDRITVIGNLESDSSLSLNQELSFNPHVHLYNTGHERFSADIEGICHVEYDKIKAQARGTRNIRVEFNPNNISESDKKMIYDLFVSKMKNKSFSRLDLAFDLDTDLSAYFIMTTGYQSQMKKTIFYGSDGRPETKYFGTRKSNRYIRIYNKKQELKDNKELEIESEHFWRIEFELKRERTEDWENCLEGLEIIQPSWEDIENVNEKMKMYALLHEEKFWGDLSRNSKYKYKKMMLEISPINLKNDLQSELENQNELIKNELNYWLA